MLSKFDIDFGTPECSGERSVSLEIDGNRISVPAGTTILRAATEQGARIPKLCASDNLEPFGSCRLCLVEVEGRKGYPASCTTPVEPGMKVRTRSPKLDCLRRGVMELYISDHPLDCLTCPANGNCELQDMAGAAGLRERAGYEGANHLHERRMNRIPTSPTTPPSASSAAAACAPARRCRAPSL
jgi:formate dehydrogenase major subunit